MMLENLLTLGGYGFYVWPAFIFTFSICAVYYFKTKKDLVKQEKLFTNELKDNHIIKFEIDVIKENKQKALSQGSA